MLNLVLILLSMYCLSSTVKALEGGNVCLQSIRFSYQVYKVQSKHICYSKRCYLLGTCYKIKKVYYTESETLYQLKYVKLCCSGYHQRDNQCHPICENKCVNGKCVAPNTCLCSPGWRGSLCSSICASGYWGQNCTQICSCKNGATCNPENGKCLCTKGWIGASCDIPCKRGTFGTDCKEICQCQNNGICHHVNGNCDCLSGYFGNHCESRCQPWTFGKYCKQHCNCILNNTIDCDHVNGNCNCQPGYIGTSCENQCQPWTFGLNCGEKCNCSLNNTIDCDHVNGNCNCLSGYFGNYCNNPCQQGTSGANCNDKCSCIINNTIDCNSIDGQCKCSPGWKDKQCEMICDLGEWGPDCKNNCTCEDCSFITDSCRATDFSIWQTIIEYKEVIAGTTAILLIVLVSALALIIYFKNKRKEPVKVSTINDNCFTENEILQDEWGNQNKYITNEL